MNRFVRDGFGSCFHFLSIKCGMERTVTDFMVPIYCHFQNNFRVSNIMTHVSAGLAMFR